MRILRRKTCCFALVFGVADVPMQEGQPMLQGQS